MKKTNNQLSQIQNSSHAVQNKRPRSPPSRFQNRRLPISRAGEEPPPPNRKIKRAIWKEQSERDRRGAAVRRGNLLIAKIAPGQAAPSLSASIPPVLNRIQFGATTATIYPPALGPPSKSNHHRRSLATPAITSASPAGHSSTINLISNALSVAARFTYPSPLSFSICFFSIPRPRRSLSGSSAYREESGSPLGAGTKG